MQRLHHLLRTSIALAGLAAVLLSALPGIPALASPRLQDEPPATLRIAMPPLTTLDPVQVSRFDPFTRDLVENLFVGLTRYDPLTQQIEPMLAESWTVSEDGLTWTFTLRQDIPWVRYDPDSGEVVAVRPVVAGDFVYAIQRACDPLRPSPITANLMTIQGCQTVANAFPEVIDDLFIAREVGITATSPTTLEIRLLFPSAYFLTLTSTPEFRPLPREAVASREATWTGADTIITSGPYALQGWDSNGLALVRNPHWPDAVAGNVGAIEAVFTGESTTAPALAARGAIDLARLLPEEIAGARQSAAGLLHSGPGSSLAVIGFSYDRALVDTPEVRRALSMAIDRQALTDQFLPGQALPAASFTPPGMVATPQNTGVGFDPAQAQASFEAAGFPGCNNLPETLLVLVPSEDPTWSAIGQFIVEQWSANLGCHPALFEVRPLARVLLIELSHAAYDTEKVTRSHMWYATWSADYPDANAWIADALHCRYGYIRPGRACDETDALLDQAAAESDPARRAELYAQAEDRLFGPNGSFPVIPLYLTTSAWLQQPWLSGVNEYGPARFDLWTIDTSQQAG